MRADQPELRIVAQDLWDLAKARQKALDTTLQGLHRNNRPNYLLSGLLKCGACGGGYSKINSERYGCSQSRNKGTSVCSNKKTIKRDKIEALVLNALKTHLMRDDLVKIFCAEYTKHFNKLQSQQDQTLKGYKSEQTKLTTERANIVQAIKDGMPADLLKDDLLAVTDRLEKLSVILKAKPTSEPLLHPAMAQRYRKSISDLTRLLNQEDVRGEAHIHLRGLIEKIMLTPMPEQDELAIDLYGSLAGILKIASQENPMNNHTGIKKRLRQIAVNDNYSTEPSIELVAGARFELTTFGL